MAAGPETATTADTPASRAIFVVGAGRSGTSAITRGLQALGVELGDRLKPPTGKNPTGFFEDLDLLRIAKRVRSELGLRAESVSLIEDSQWSLPGLDALTEEAVGVIRDRFARYPLWGFKYAQTLRMLPFWEPVMRRAGVELEFVVAARNPLSVARSRSKLDPLRGIQEKTDLEWLVNVLPYFRRLAAHRFTVVEYDLLMEDPRAQLRRIAERMAIPLDPGVEQGIEAFAGEFLKPGMRHTRFADDDLAQDPRLNPLTRDAYRWLRRLATDQVTPDDPELWDDLARIETQLSADAPMLRHIDFLETELRRNRGGRLGRLAARWFGS
ncbi:MAG: sulfotransferase [Gammaproteobacteria bacterium]